MTIHPDERQSATTEVNIAKMNFQHKCNTYGRTFPTLRGKQIHEARWCTGDPNQRSRRGTLADQWVHLKKKVAAVDELDHVTCGHETFQNVYNLTYLGSEISASGSSASDMERRVCLATAKFNALYHMWRDGRLSCTLQTALYHARIVPVLLYSCESWELSHTTCKKIRGFHALGMKWIFNTAEHTVLCEGFGGGILRMVHRRRWLWLDHLLRTPRERLIS